MMLDWESIDWTRRDVDIAKEVGRSRERVRQVRRRDGRAESANEARRKERRGILAELATADMKIAAIKQALPLHLRNASRHTLANDLRILGQEWDKLPPPPKVKWPSKIIAALQSGPLTSRQIYEVLGVRYRQTNVQKHLRRMTDRGTLVHEGKWRNKQYRVVRKPNE